MAMFVNLLKWFTRLAGKENTFVNDQEIKEIITEELRKLFSIKIFITIHLSLTYHNTNDEFPQPTTL